MIKNRDNTKTRVPYGGFYRVLGLSLIVVGLAFYFAWSIMYGTWFDIGLYSFVIVLIVFGILSIALIDAKEKEGIA
ncbi:MAG: hypothetical protein ACYCSA_07695 [Thermoplasmataceae archaeon]